MINSFFEYMKNLFRKNTYLLKINISFIDISNLLK